VYKRIKICSWKRKKEGTVFSRCRGGGRINRVGVVMARRRTGGRKEKKRIWILQSSGLKEEEEKGKKKRKVAVCGRLEKKKTPKRALPVGHEGSAL